MTRKIPFFAVLIPLVFFGCSGSEPDPEGAEEIYQPSEESAALARVIDSDGYTVVYDHIRTSCRPLYYALYTPAGNLRMLLSGCSECGYVCGYKVLYNADGSVREVIRIPEVYENCEVYPEREGTGTLKGWMKDKNLEGEHFRITRDENGKVSDIGDIHVPYSCTASYFIKEWGPFWTNDVEGGELGFFVLLSENDKAGKSTVDYLYVDGHLVAELAYWNGHFTKSLYYNREGHFWGIDESADADVFNNALWHYSSTGGMSWYLGTKWR